VGSVIITDPDGVSGNPTIDLTTTDANIALKAATADLASNDNAKGASGIGIEDSLGLIIATNVEGALAELAAGKNLKVETGGFTSDGTNNRLITTGIPVGSTLVEVVVSNQVQSAYSHWSLGDSGSVFSGAGSIALNLVSTSRFIDSGVNFIVGTSGVNGGASAVGWTAKYF